VGEELAGLRMAALGHESDAKLHRQRIETLLSQGGESAARRDALNANIERLRAENAEHRRGIGDAGRERDERRASIAAIEQRLRELRAERDQKEVSIRGQTTRERAISDERVALGKEIARLSEQKVGMEQQYESTVAQLWDEYELTPREAEGLCLEIGTGGIASAGALRRRVGELRGKIKGLGDVHVGAIEQYAEVRERWQHYTTQVGDLEVSKRELEKLIAELASEMCAMFAQSFAEINRHFGRIFVELFGGGRASLSLTDPGDLLESGIDIAASPPGKSFKDLMALSGGEKALVAVCIYFAILAVNPAPFCVLDEIDAAFDDANIQRFAQYLRRISGRTQFIVITHRRGTMEEADVLYGVTMQEDGVSKLLKLDVAEAGASLVQ
jgi:chromosome segregation protein